MAKKNEEKKMTPIAEVRGTIMRMAPQFKAALPPHISPDKFMRVVMTAITMEPKLLAVNRGSLYGECMKAAQDGLLLDGREAAMLAYGSVAKYMPMVGGVCKKARNSGEIKTIDAQVVCENDQYESWTDEKGPHFKHVKARKNRGEDILTYAYAITKDDGFYFEEIDEDQMKAIEACAKGNGPWKGPFRQEMKRKSALHRLCKYRIPSSTDLDLTLKADEDLYELPSNAPKAKTQEGRPGRLGNIIEAKVDKKEKTAEQKVDDGYDDRNDGTIHEGDQSFEGEEAPI